MDTFAVNPGVDVQRITGTSQLFLRPIDYIPQGIYAVRAHIQVYINFFTTGAMVDDKNEMAVLRILQPDFHLVRNSPVKRCGEGFFNFCQSNKLIKNLSFSRFIF